MWLYVLHTRVSIYIWPLCSRSARRSMNLLQLDEKWKLESCAHYLLKIASALFGGFGENRLAVYFHVMPLPHPLLVKSQCGTTWNSRISSPKREAIYRVPYVGCHQLVPYSNLVMRCLALLAISLSLAKCQCKFSLLLQWQLTILLLSLSLWLNLLPIWFIISTKMRSIPHPTLTSIHPNLNPIMELHPYMMRYYSRLFIQHLQHPRKTFASILALMKDVVRSGTQDHRGNVQLHYNVQLLMLSCSITCPCTNFSLVHTWFSKLRKPSSA